MKVPHRITLTATHDVTVGTLIVIGGSTFLVVSTPSATELLVIRPWWAWFVDVWNRLPFYGWWRSAKRLWWRYWDA